MVAVFTNSLSRSNSLIKRVPLYGTLSATLIESELNYFSTQFFQIIYGPSYTYEWQL